MAQARSRADDLRAGVDGGDVGVLMEEIHGPVPDAAAPIQDPPSTTDHETEDAPDERCSGARTGPNNLRGTLRR